MTKNRRVLLTLAAALVVLAGTLLLFNASSQPVRAAGTLCVAPGGVGCDSGTCGGACYASVQDAVDAAAPGDEIRVATGTYTGVQARGAMTQVVYISKTVTLRGGYNSDLTVWDPDVYPTTLDAQGQGRVVSIVGAGGAVLASFTVTGGNGDGMTASCPVIIDQSAGCGGGVFVLNAPAIIVSNVITNNVGGVSTGDFSTDGGGLCLSYANGAKVISNLIISNTASLGNRGAGGGVALYYPYDVIMDSNQVISNVATVHDSLPGPGGGLVVYGSGAAATIRNNRIEGNRTNGGNTWPGGGIYLWNNPSDFESNRVVGNYGGAAVYLGVWSMARFESNQVVDNNTPIGVEMATGGSSNPTLANNAVVRSGDKAFSFSANSSYPLTATLIHNTLIGDGAGSGVHVGSAYVTLHLTNTIVANHAWGISNTVPASSTVTADHTLFWANEQDGIVGTNPVYGDPAFVDFGMGGYHLGPGSAAIDAGVATTENVDIDGDSRPLGSAPDIGADEVMWLQAFLPLVLRNH